MGINSLSLVNQKLTHARLLQAAARNTGSDATLCRALQEAVAGQLVCAYRHYLRELAENYRVKFPASITTEQQLQAALAELNKNPSEVQELVQLRIQADSWLARLHESYDYLWALAVSPKAGRESAGLIAVVALDAAEPTTLSLEFLDNCYQCFIDLIQRQRETSAEW